MEGLEFVSDCSASTTLHLHQLNSEISEPLRTDEGHARENSTSKSVQKIFYGEDDYMEIFGFMPNKVKRFTTYFFYFTTLGLLRLFFHWYPHLQLFATHSKCKLEMAEKLLIINVYKSKFKSHHVENAREIKSRNKLKIHLENGKTMQTEAVQIFNYKKMVFVWDPDEGLYVKLAGLDAMKRRSDLHLSSGISQEEQESKRIIYGLNEINIPVQSVLNLFILEALTPFYIFQVFSVLLWIAEFYFYYSFAIIIMSIYGISSSIIQTRTNQKNLRGTVYSNSLITVLRPNGSEELIKTSNLAPGDLIAIPRDGYTMSCDAVLLKGTCVVNESMLTGESVPVHKTQLACDANYYKSKEDANHTLFCGTTVLQTKCLQTLALVIRTGYLTTKGEVVRSILYPPPADFKFDQDSYKFIGILSVIAILGLVYTYVTKTSRKIPFWDVTIKALDLVTIAIPPALPAAMTIGKLYAVERLKTKNIYCINSRVVNVSGSVDCACFDKTGTLTEDELDLWGVVPVKNGQLEEHIRENFKMLRPVYPALFKGMLTCHSLSLLGGKLNGYPLDLKMFSATEWNYREPGNCEEKLTLESVVCNPENDETVGIYAQFPFVSSLQRSSVICKDFTEIRGDYEAFCKGSPETILKLCKPESASFDVYEKLKQFTTKGFRVIAMGSKKISSNIDISKLSRHEIETDLNFLGLIVLENRLKPQSSAVIAQLKNANFDVKMITGDNIQTAISVAKECGIVDKKCFIVQVVATYALSDGAKLRYSLHDTDILNNYPDVETARFNHHQFVLDGKSWSNILKYYPEMVPEIAANGVVFARMSSQQKRQLIEEIKNRGRYVSMCGDGANDCAALKAAHLGISLSEAEASIAAPFTSKEHNVKCVPEIIREGRAALTTSFGIFKFMICGALVEFFCTIILYGIDCNLSSMQFLFIDIFLQLNLASFFGNTHAREELYRKAPQTSLLSFTPITSMLLFMLNSTFFQLFAFHFVRNFDQYAPFVYNPHDHANVTKCHENYPTFIVAMFQYITMAVIFSKGEPYRKPIYTNKIFTFLIISITFLCTFMTLFPINSVKNVFEIDFPFNFEMRWQLAIIVLINFLIAIFIEEFLIDVVLAKAPLFNRLHALKGRENRKMPIGQLNEISRQKAPVDVDHVIKSERTLVTKC